MQQIAAVVLVAALQACTVGPDTELKLEVDSSERISTPAGDASAARLQPTVSDVRRLPSKTSAT